MQYALTGIYKKTFLQQVFRLGLSLTLCFTVSLTVLTHSLGNHYKWKIVLSPYMHLNPVMVQCWATKKEFVSAQQSPNLENT